MAETVDLDLQFKHDEQYFEKTFVEPEYIWDGNYCDLSLLSNTVLEHDEARLQLLAIDQISVQHSTTSSLATTVESILQPIHLLRPSGSDLAGSPEASSEAASISAASAAPIKSIELPLLSDVMNAAEPINFHTQFHIGSPPRPFYLDIDSGSSLLWVQADLGTDAETLIPGTKDLGDSTSASAGLIKDQSVYRPDASQTSSELDWERGVTTYGDGSSVKVSFYTDTVMASVFSAKEQTLGAAVPADLNMRSKLSKSNGLIGLGFGLVGSGIPAHSNFVQTLHNEGMIRYASYAIVGPRNDPEEAARIDEQGIQQPRGTCVIGALETKFYTGEIEWCPCVEEQRWVIKLDEVKVNGKVLFRNQSALIDTGTALIRVSPHIFNEFKASVAGSNSHSDRNLFTYPEDSIRSISFVFGAREFSLTETDLTLGRVHNTPNNRRVSSICRTSTWKGPWNLWILGGIFIDNIVTIFDFNEKRLGLATIS